MNPANVLLVIRTLAKALLAPPVAATPPDLETIIFRERS
jgi:hypothetical protein